MKDVLFYHILQHITPIDVRIWNAVSHKLMLLLQYLVNVVHSTTKLFIEYKHVLEQMRAFQRECQCFHLHFYTCNVSRWDLRLICRFGTVQWWGVMFKYKVSYIEYVSCSLQIWTPKACIGSPVPVTLRLMSA